jgi:putative transposase
MNLSRSTYYYRSKNKPDEEQELLERIEAVIEEFPGYGYRRVARELHRRGFRDNHKKVLRIMKEHGLTKKPRRRWVCTTNSRHALRVYPNLAPNLRATGPNQLWVADLTYIGILSGFVYLAILLDLFARRVVGYALSRRIDTALCLEALRVALIQRKPPAGIIHHSDRGVQYASSINMASASACPAKEIPTTTRRLRVSSKP